MDPAATIQRAFDALKNNDLEEVQEAIADYKEWRRKGGFQPGRGDETMRDLERFVKQKRKTNPVRATPKRKRAAMKLVRRYGKPRARKVAGGMIGTAKTPAQREHFAAVRRILNPTSRRIRVTVFGDKHKAALRMSAAGIPFAFIREIPKADGKWTEGWISRTHAPTFGAWLGNNPLAGIMGVWDKNPAQRKMPITPEDRGILRAMTKEHGAKALRKAIPKKNPAVALPYLIEARPPIGGRWHPYAGAWDMSRAKEVALGLGKRGLYARVFRKR